MESELGSFLHNRKMPCPLEIQRELVAGGRRDPRGNSHEAPIYRPMDMAAHNARDILSPHQHPGKSLTTLKQADLIHGRKSGFEGRMMHGDKNRLHTSAFKLKLKPGKLSSEERPMGLPFHQRIQTNDPDPSHIMGKAKMFRLHTGFRPKRPAHRLTQIVIARHHKKRDTECVQARCCPLIFLIRTRLRHITADKDQVRPWLKSRHTIHEP